MSGKIKACGEKTCYPKLAAQGGQLFASTGDTISVFSGADHVRADVHAAVQQRRRGCIGGHRLFALHSTENVFDICWETPRPPII